MCDALSMMSAGSSFMGGLIESRDARSRGNFDAAMIEVQSMLSAAQTRADQAQLSREFDQAARQNIVAQAVSGLASQSFAGVRNANRAELNRGMTALETTKRTRQIGMTAEKAMTLANARAEASAAMYSGFLQAGSTLYAAEQTYQQANTGQTRIEWFKESLK